MSAARTPAHDSPQAFAPVVQFDWLGEVYVRRGDVAKLLEERTFTKDQVAA